MEVLRVENLQKTFPIGKGLVVRAVSGIDISISEGETLGLVGESGCGKTTTGRCVVRLIEPTEGKITLLGEDVTRIPQSKFKKYRSKVQIVFQNPYDSLNPRKTVKRILEDPLIIEKKLDKKARLGRVKEVLQMVELAEDRLDKFPIQLTQGEQQRVGIARALATNPQIIVLDEPTSLLDIRFRAEIIALLQRLQKELAMSYLFISHDLVVIAQLSHRISVMYLGRIVEEGPTDAVFGSPIHPYTRALFSAALFPDPNQNRGGFKLKGEVPSPVNLPDNRCNLAPRCPMVKDCCHKSLPALQEAGQDHWVACFNLGGQRK
jgi:oligopeptide transport system ATP-binding protein